jgi:hypothetical protein
MKFLGLLKILLDLEKKLKGMSLNKPSYYPLSDPISGSLIAPTAWVSLKNLPKGQNQKFQKILNKIRKVQKSKNISHIPQQTHPI